MRTLLSLALALACVAPAMAAYNLQSAREVAVAGVGWGILVSPYANHTGAPYMLWVFKGDDIATGHAWSRARIVAERLRTAAPLLRGNAAVGQIILRKVPGSPDWEIAAEGLIGGEYKPMTLVTVDRRLSKPYGATNWQLGNFWVKRLKGLAMVPADDAHWTAVIPKDILPALLAHWSCWKR